MPPGWINEDGQRAKTRPCRRPGCGREVPIQRYSHQTLRLIGWPLYRLASVVQWCGHRQEFIPVPDDGEWVRLVPVIGTAKSRDQPDHLTPGGTLFALTQPSFLLA